MKKITFLFAVLFVLPSTVFGGTNDIVNYWTLDEGAGRSVGDQVGGANGVMTGESKGFGWASGKSKTALGFDGSLGTGVVIPDASLKGSQGTISVWLKLNILSDGNVIFSGRSTSDTNVYVILMVDREGRVTQLVRDSASGNERVLQSTKILNTNEWYHVVFTANSQGYRIIVNGEDFPVAGDNSGRWIPDFTNQTLMYRIGMVAASSRSGSFNGYLDDLRVYSRPLSLDEAKTLYIETDALKPTVPLAIAPTLSFTISSDSIPFGGSVALRWSTTNVTSCSKSGSWNGDAGTAGESVQVKLGTDATYTLSCGGGKGGSISSSVMVKVATSTTASSPSVVKGGVLTVTDNMTTPTSSGTIDPKGLTREQLIQAIKAKIAELQALLKTMGY